ncbi:type I restriction enzyme EcoKI subunit R [Escherichia coli]|uniref:Type I restriction enzyme EcoKI subunit R n=1 Tax=Escherichia coli TaxID=562 RepID=A0A376MQ74_ECOLX|nr:type I restriction enzyme EcoKI subunit R [Escherichia coli]
MSLIATANASIMASCGKPCLEHYSPDEVHEAVPEYETSWQDTSGQQRFKIPFCYSTNGREYRAAMKTKSGHLVSRRA